MIVNMANFMAEQGHGVTLLVQDGQGPHKERVSAQVGVHDFGRSRSLACMGDLARYVRENRPDILLSAMTHSNVTAILSRFFWGRAKTKLVVTERTFLSAHVKKTPSIKDRVLPLAVRALYGRADKIVGISKGVAEDIRKLSCVPESKVSFIYNPVVTQRLKLDYESEEAVNLKDRAEQSIILTSGRLSFEKDYAALVDAFAKLRALMDAKLVFLGDGPLKAELSAQAENLEIPGDVHFAGHVGNSMRYMKGADLFVMSSLFEGFCNVIVEALYCGLPVVSTDAPSGPREILEDGAYGKLTPVGDTDALAQAMEEALEQTPDKEKLRNRAMRFTDETICAEYEALFRSLTGDK